MPGLLVLVLGTSMAQPPVSRLTLEEAVMLATRENTTIRAKAFERQATAAQEITAALRPNPTASFSAEQLASRPVEPQYTVAVEQTIETGGKRQRRIAAARAATRVVDFEVDDTRRQIATQVKKAFTDALLAQALLALANQNLQTIDEVERLQRLRAAKGDIAELELTRLQVQRFAFERDAADAAQALQAAKISLRTLVGPETVAEDVTLIGDLAYRDRVLERESLLRQALARRPDLRAAEATRQRAQAEVALARANASWDLTPQLQYQRIGSDNTLGVGLSIPLRLFDRNQGEIARSRAEIQHTDALLEAAVIQIRADVATALSQIQAARQKVSLLQDTYLPKAQRARETVAYAYRHGGLSLLDFLDAERTYRETVIEHLRTLAGYWTALYELEAAVGGELE